MFVFETSRAELISLLRATRTPFPRDASSAATPEALQEVGRAVVAQRLRRSHGADDNHWLIAADGQMEKIRSFLEGVRSGCNYDARKVGTARQKLVNPTRELEPLVESQHAARDVVKLLSLGDGIPIEERNRFDQLLGGQTSAGSTRHSTAGGDQADRWE